MELLEELRATFFPGPVTQIFYGEPASRRIIETVLRESRIDPIEGPDADPGTLRLLAAGTYPILIQSYDDFRFDDLVTEDQLRDYLRVRADRPEPRILATFAGHGDHVGIIYRFVERIGDRPCRSLDVGRALKFYFAALPGEHLVIATLGRAPVPGDQVCA